MRKLLLINLIWLWLIPEVMAQQQVSGKITDYSTGEALPGVNILVKGTGTGTITDIDGNYKLDVLGPDAILSFSFIGYEGQEVSVGTQTNVTISLMPDLKTLDEVVVVGYGTMKKRDMTSAHTTIGSEDIKKTVNTTIEQAIQGRSAGVYVTQNTGQPGGGISVNIRGISSITGNTEPLYVIDGVQITPGQMQFGSASSSNELARLNPADIESMEILQGPSATAIYGSRATNGVIIITTKRGRAGETLINYGFSYSLQDKPEKLEVMNLPQYATMYNAIRELNGGEGPEEFKDPTLLNEGTDWQDALFQTAPLQKHQLSLSGGNEKTQFYLSGEYFDQEGIAIGSGFERYSIRLNLDNKVRDWLKLNATLNYSQTNENLSATQESVINNALTLAPNIPVKSPTGEWGGPDATNDNSVQFTPLNPVAIANLVSNDLNRKGLLGGLGTEITLTKGLVFRTNFNVDIGSKRQDYFIPTYRLGNKINDMASLTVTSGNNFYWNWNQLLQYDLTLNKHAITVLAGHEAQESNWDQVVGGRLGFVSNTIRDLNIGNAAGATANGGQGEWAQESYFGRLNYSFNEKYLLQGAIRADGSANFGIDNRWGYFPSVSAAWRISEEPFMDNVPQISELKLRVETGVTGNQGSGGRQYSPLQARNTPWGSGFRAERYGNPELKWEETTTYNAGFNLSLFDNRVQLEGDVYLKQTKNLLVTQPLPDYFGTQGEGSIGSPTVNLGELENRGWAFTLNTINIDRGDFRWTSNFNISGFKTELTKLYADNAFVERAPWFVGNNWAQRAEPGKAPWLFRGYIYEGLFQSVEEIEESAIPADNNGNRLPVEPGSIWVGDIKFKDLNDDGIINEQDRTDIGNPWPKFTLGFSNSINFKGFELGILLTGVYGNDVFNLLRFNNTNPNNINLGRNLLVETFDYAKIEGEGNSATLVNPDTHIPRISTSDVNGNRARYTDQYVEDGSYIRVKNISLGYSLPTSILENLGFIKGARISLGVQNIYTFTKYEGYDPEVGAYVGRDASADTQSIGLDFGRYPITPVYTFSVGIDL